MLALGRSGILFWNPLDFKRGSESHLLCKINIKEEKVVSGRMTRKNMKKYEKSIGKGDFSGGLNGVKVVSCYSRTRFWALLESIGKTFAKGVPKVI